MGMVLAVMVSHKELGIGGIMQRDEIMMKILTAPADMLAQVVEVLKGQTGKTTPGDRGFFIHCGWFGFRFGRHSATKQRVECRMFIDLVW